ncbi:hypothetical protein U1Q18_052426 [Sarracenia purpurea var. burkii]
MIHSVFVRCEGEEIEVPIEYQGLPPMCDHCKSFGHASHNCKESKLNNSVSFQKVGAGECKKHDSQSDSSDSMEWVRVSKRRNVNKRKRQEKRMDVAKSNIAMPMVQRARKGYSQSRSFPFVGQSVAQPLRSARSTFQHRNSALDQPGAQPCRSAPSADLASCSFPHRSPASQASLLREAVEGSGSLGTILI